jgi:hypothetical protein
VRVRNGDIADVRRRDPDLGQLRHEGSGTAPDWGART